MMRAAAENYCAGNSSLLLIKKFVVLAGVGLYRRRQTPRRGDRLLGPAAAAKEEC